MIRSICLVLVTGAAMMPILAAAEIRSPIPLEKGTEWVYEAKVRWTPVDGEGPPGIRSAQFKWTAAIVKSIQGKAARAAVVHAWPDEVAGMDPVLPSGYSVLLETSNRLDRLHAKSKHEAGRLARRFATAPERPAASAYVYLDLPLRVGARWDEAPDGPRREDGWYCWHVESRTEKPIDAKGVPPIKAAVVFTLAYRTNPDHQLVEIAPGIGIVRFEYEHHGTVASCDVRLIEFKRAPARRSTRTAHLPLSPLAARSKAGVDAAAHRQSRP